MLRINKDKDPLTLKQKITRGVAGIAAGSLAAGGVALTLGEGESDQKYPAKDPTQDVLNNSQLPEWVKGKAPSPEREAKPTLKHVRQLEFQAPAVPENSRAEATASILSSMSKLISEDTGELVLSRLPAETTSDRILLPEVYELSYLGSLEDFDSRAVQMLGGGEQLEAAVATEPRGQNIVRLTLAPEMIDAVFSEDSPWIESATIRTDIDYTDVYPQFYGSEKNPDEDVLNFPPSPERPR